MHPVMQHCNVTATTIAMRKSTCLLVFRLDMQAPLAAVQYFLLAGHQLASNGCLGGAVQVQLVAGPCDLKQCSNISLFVRFAG